MGSIVEAENHLRSFSQKGSRPLCPPPRRTTPRRSGLGFSDTSIRKFLATEEEVRARRMADAVILIYKAVDTCAAEFEATPRTSTPPDEQENEALPVPDKESVIILGSGPNRIGQGIEFVDHRRVHAVVEMRELGYQAIMVNCNPETVSTDYDTSDRLYFEPLTFEDVLDIIENEKPKGVVVQFGGQTPLKIAERLNKAGVPIMGTSQDAIDLAEDRERFEVLKKDRLPREGSIFISVADAEKDTMVLMALVLSTLGFRILATEGTHRTLTLNGIDSVAVLKHTEGEKLRAALEEAAAAGLAVPPAIEATGAIATAAGATVATPPVAVTTIVDLIENGRIDLVINIPRGRGARSDGYEIARGRPSACPHHDQRRRRSRGGSGYRQRPPEPGDHRDLSAGFSRPAGSFGGGRSCGSSGSWGSHGGSGGGRRAVRL